VQRSDSRIEPVGVLILFRWGMPFRVRSGGAGYLMLQQIDEKAIAAERRYTMIGYIGLALLVLGSVLQMVAVLVAKSG